MPTLSRVLTIGCLGLLASAGAAAPAAAFTPAGVSPTTVAAPGTVDFRFTLQGIDQDSSISVSPSPIRVAATEFTDDASSLDITGARVEGAGSLRTESLSIADMVPGCIRGATIEPERVRYLLDVPARATATIVVTAKVPAVFRGAQPGVELSYSPPIVPGLPTLSIAYTARQTVSSSTYVEGVSLKAGKRSKGLVRVSGRVSPARRGAKVTFVTRPASSEVLVDSVFGFPESTFTPKDGLRTVGSTRTTKGGKFTATLKVKSGVGLAARTTGAHAGSSCGVFIDRDRTPVAAP